MQTIRPNIQVTYGAIFVSGLVVGMLVFVFVNRSIQGTLGSDVAVDLSGHRATMRSCIGDVVSVAPDKMNPGIYERIWRLCGNQIFNGLYLDDYLIRRQKFMQQALDERVNLWLVVTITFSGVLLATLQLLLSYKLATDRGHDFAKDSELAIEAGKNSLKSSITGVLILALSLAFFMIYVVYIYSIRELPFDRPVNLQTPAEPQEAEPPPQAGPPVSVGPPQPPSPPKGAKK
jgi:hypothetical protein